ncbi:hypothetical protein EV197_0358 [Aquimarina brevivitae]|uniref:Uncharacterized protein n=1 Tax=Aquimarina brevivitae TaxID=323412 RepID=A0A4Q7PH94_9FLAO|nr:hypothetical protein EV197_0358 [Aquimarina brevivitae]
MIELLKLIIIKELRHNLLLEYLLMSMIFVLVIYSGVNLLLPFLILLIPERFIYSFWNRKEERLFISLNTSEFFGRLLFVNRLRTIVESNIIYMFSSVIVTQKLDKSLLIFNTYLFFFFILGDIVFLILRDTLETRKWTKIISIIIPSILSSVIAHYLNLFSKPMLIFLLIFISSILFSLLFIKKIKLSDYFRL